MLVLSATVSVNCTLTLPSAPVLLEPELNFTVPLSACHATAIPGTGCPCASSTVTVAVLVVLPSAGLLSWSTVRLLINAVATSAVNVVFTLRDTLFAVAVTTVVPIERFVSVVDASPLASVTTEVFSSTAPFPALNATVIPATALPRASVTLACTTLVAFPSATALSFVIFRSLRVAASSGKNVTLTSAALPFSSVAVIFASPATTLVISVVAIPCASVVALAANRVPALVANLTANPGTGWFVCVSITVRRTVFWVLPSASALSFTTTNDEMSFRALWTITTVSALFDLLWRESYATALIR